MNIVDYGVEESICEVTLSILFEDGYRDGRRIRTYHVL